MLHTLLPGTHYSIAYLVPGTPIQKYDTAILLHEPYAHLRVRVALVLSYHIVELCDRAPLPLCIARDPRTADGSVGCQ